MPKKKGEPLSYSKQRVLDSLAVSDSPKVSLQVRRNVVQSRSPQPLDCRPVLFHDLVETRPHSRR